MGLLSRVIGPEPTPEERLRKMEIEHAERMKLIETGQPLPEVAIARAKAASVQASMDAAKANVRAIFGALGPAAVFGVTTGITAIILHGADKSNHLVMLLILWPCAATVCLALVTALWFGAAKGVAPPKLLARLPKTTPIPSARTPSPDDYEGSDVDTSDLTQEEIDKLARAIQK
jgi:hypothetical protein